MVSEASQGNGEAARQARDAARRRLEAALRQRRALDTFAADIQRSMRRHA